MGVCRAGVSRRWEIQFRSVTISSGGRASGAGIASRTGDTAGKIAAAKAEREEMKRQKEERAAAKAAKAAKEAKKMAGK